MPLGNPAADRACAESEADCAKPAAVCCRRMDAGGCGKELAETREEANVDAQDTFNACSD